MGAVFTGELANPNQSIAEKDCHHSRRPYQKPDAEDGTTKNVYLIKRTTFDNSLQVINQYATPARRSLGVGGEDDQRANRYDVTVLVNGLPLVHIAQAPWRGYCRGVQSDQSL